MTDIPTRDLPAMYWRSVGRRFDKVRRDAKINSIGLSVAAVASIPPYILNRRWWVLLGVATYACLAFVYYRKAHSAARRRDAALFLAAACKQGDGGDQQ